MSLNELLSSHEPVAHPLKAVLEKEGMSIASAAKYCGLSYPYFHQVLAGARTASQEVELLMNELLEASNA